MELEGEGPLFAYWFTGVLRIPKGELLQYVHMGFGSVFEEELHVKIEKGIVTNTKTLDNRNKEHNGFELKWANMPGNENRFSGDDEFETTEELHKEEKPQTEHGENKKLPTGINEDCDMERLGIDVNARDSNGWTPLMEALHRNNVETARVFIEAGADVNVKNSHGRTPLMWAASLEKPEALHVLIKAGADVNAKDTDG